MMMMMMMKSVLLWDFCTSLVWVPNLQFFVVTSPSNAAHLRIDFTVSLLQLMISPHQLHGRSSSHLSHSIA